MKQKWLGEIIMGTVHRETDWLAHLCNSASPYQRSTHRYQSKLDKKWYWSYHFLPEVKLELELFQAKRKVLNHWLLYGEFERPKPKPLTDKEQEEISLIVETALAKSLEINKSKKRCRA